jgi:carbon-monoxide dehydrogenase large subunit
MLLAAQEVAKKAHALAAVALQSPESAITFKNGVYTSADGSTTFEALALQHAGDGPHPLSLDFEAKFGATFPNGCHIAEVEIDRATGVAQVVRYTACDDIGNVVNHQIVEGQVHGGLAQGAGEVFGEEAVYDAETGQLLTGSFMDYPMPRVSWVPPLTLLESPVPTAVNPLGVKGVGEAGTTGSMPALMNAVLDALRGAGVRHFDMPATPARLWAALQAAGLRKR